MNDVEMEIYLSTKVLANDSAEALQKVYSYIIRAITYGFSCQLDIMPTFNDPDKEIRFEPLFLQGLFSDNLRKAKSVFDQIGEIILDFLQSNDTISKSRTPKADTIIKANKFVSGWVLLECLLKQRLAICGADIDDDLDEKRVKLEFLPNESFQEFYVRTQMLMNEYHYNATDISFIPVVKIVRKFLQQLSRCEACRPSLTSFQTQLSDLSESLELIII